MALVLSIITSLLICGVVVFFIFHPHVRRMFLVTLVLLLLALLCLELITRGIHNLSSGGGILLSIGEICLGWLVISFFINS